MEPILLLILPQNRGQTEINPISDKDLKFHKKKDKDVKYCGFGDSGMKEEWRIEHAWTMMRTNSLRKHQS